MEIKVNELSIEQLKQFNPTLYEAIRNETDPNEKISELTEQLDAEKAAKEALTTERDNLKKENEDLTKERDELKGKVDVFEAEKALNGKKELVDNLIKEAELPKEIVSDFFKESLCKLDKEEGIKAAIADRKEMADKNKGKVKESGEEFTGHVESKDEITEEDTTTVLEAFKS